MADWATISSLATAGGTLVLAVATFQSVRSANRPARLAEWSLMEGVRPVLIPSRDDDPDQQVSYEALTGALAGNAPLWIDLLYGDYEGGPRTTLRTRLAEREDDGGGRVTALRYWNLDRDDPR